MLAFSRTHFLAPFSLYILFLNYSIDPNVFAFQTRANATNIYVFLSFAPFFEKQYNTLNNYLVFKVSATIF